MVALFVSVATTGSSVAVDQGAIPTAQPTIVAAREPSEPRLHSAGALAVAPNGDLFHSDVRTGVIRRFDTRVFDRWLRTADSYVYLSRVDARDDLAFTSAAGAAIAANGDLYVADAENHRICRIERVSGKIITVAGDGSPGGFDGDDVQATQTALNRPNAVAVARNGDLYVADTLNHRVRLITQATGLIRTIAGDGNPGEADTVGDGGPSTAAHLNRPTDVALAPNGDLYIADMGHNRVRVVDAKTGVITTVAGDGRFGRRGDGGLAVAASLGGPAGLVLVNEGRQVRLFIAEYFNGRVLVVDPHGIVSTVGEPGRFTAPSRLAYRAGGWLYVASDDGSVTAFNVAKVHPYQRGTIAWRGRNHT